jgi:hypothetical protein
MITLCVPLRPFHSLKMVDVGSSFHLHHTGSILTRFQGSMYRCFAKDRGLPLPPLAKKIVFLKWNFGV